MKLGKITPLLVAVIGDVMLPGSRAKETGPSFAKASTDKRERGAAHSALAPALSIVHSTRPG
jgi:hypothetical protein